MLTDIIKHKDLARLIADEDFAREFIEFLRWPNGAICPRCEATKVYKIAANPEKKVRKGLYKCSACKKQFTVTVGTIFEDSHVALNKWIHAIHLLCSSKKGFSAHQLHRTLGIRYPSAWHLMHRIRHVMADEMPEIQLDGIVECDEVYFGGKAKNMHARVRKEKIQGRGAVAKEAVFTLVERGGNVKTTHVANVTGANLKEQMKSLVAPTARIMSDESAAYNGTNEHFASHEAVNHHKGEYVRGDAHVNTSESVHSLMKRGVIGVYHHWSPAHLHRYLSEFDFRFNRRKMSDGERMIEALRKVEGKRLMYKSPITKKNSEAN
ncbi:MAG: IS1595 family transposase [Acidobacteria bacterium]|nr:IS1595 family transposase [Acidobacteriota bacterium]